MKIVERFKSFNKEDWIFNVVMLLVTTFIIYITIGVIVSYANGNYPFGQSTSDTDSFFKKNGNVLMIILLSFCSLATLAIFIYRVFFKKIDHTPATKKVLVNNRFVEEDVKIDEKEPVEEELTISTDKIKEAEKELKNQEPKK